MSTTAIPQNVPSGGLTPVGHQNGSFDFRTQRFAKAAGGTSDANLIYVGDIVRLDSSGQAVRVLAADTSASGGVFGGVLGVVAGIYLDEAGKPQVFGLPTQSPRIALSADVRYLDVYVDPGIIYAARTAASAGASFIGKTMNITTTARVTAAGISGVQIDSASSAASENPVKVVAVSEYQLDTRQGSASGVVNVILNNVWTKTQVSR